MWMANSIRYGAWEGAGGRSTRLLCHIPRMKRAFAAFLLLALGTASATEFTTEDMPPSFGKAVKPWAGCPKFAGVYEWPAVEGRLGAAPGQSNARTQHAMIGDLALGLKAFLWLVPPDDGDRLLLRAITVPHDSRTVIGMMNRGWRQKTLSGSQHTCTRGWLIIEEATHASPSADGWYGGRVLVGTRLVPLEGGDLAVGQWTRVTDRKSSIGWGEAKLLTLPAPDRVYWHWVKLRRVADSGESIVVDYSRN